MKNNYYDNDGADVQRSKRKKKKKERKALKAFLLIISVIIVALAVFLTTIKVLAPDFDFATLVPEKVQSVVSENILGRTTTTEPTTTTTTKPTTTEKPTAKQINYLEFKEFKMETAKQGNALGNLLNGGKVATDYSYVYHIADDGIYRFVADTEDYARVYKSSNKLSSLNLRGDYIYFVDETEHTLCKMQKGTSSPKAVAENVKFAYVYDSTVYYITETNSICVMDVKELQPTTLYSSADNEMRLVGISKHRVYFAVTDYSGEIDYLTIAYDGSEDIAAPFRDSETTDSKLVMENGFMYFYKTRTDGKNDVCRQKFGSEKVITIADDGDDSNYIITENNRLYYSELTDGKFCMTEYNMNSKKSRYLMTVNDVGNSHTLRIFHGGEYDLIIGQTSEGGKEIYRAGCVYTGSTNYMKFNDGDWRY